jgi:parallel beta-helix repeat protein
MLKLRLACAATVLFSLPTFAGNLCVNPHGSNGCQKTIQGAINAASPGDTINVASGRYAGSVIVDRPVALLGAGLTSTIIDATGASNGIHVDGFDNAGLSRVIVRGFTVQNADHQGILVTNASDVTIIDNRVTGNDRAIQLQSATPSCPGLPAYLAAFQGMDCGEGIQLSGVTNSTVSGNVVDHNTGGILVSDDTAPNHDNFITDNVVRDNPYDCSITLATHDLNPTQGMPAKGVYHITVSGNTVMRNGLANGEGAGVGIFAPTPGSQNFGNVIVDNTLADNGLPGVTVHSHASGQNVSGHLIANNTIYGNGPDAESGSMEKAGIAITSDPGASPITGIRISGNKVFGEGIDVVFNAPGELVAHLNSFFDSTGVANLGPGSVDATLNWWKCPRGPGHPGCSSTDGPNIQVAPVLDRPNRDR